ncbi:MAG: flagellar basal body-associated FliL family protein [Burkholderiaceae bacterium]
MAKNPSRAADAPVATGAPQSGNSKKLVLIIGALVIVLLAGGGGALWYVLDARAPANAEAQAKRASKTPVFVELDALTVNLRDRESERFLQTKVVLEMRDAPAAEALKARMPAVRNEMLLLLSGKTPDDALTREGKEKLAADLIAAAARPLAGTPAEGGIEKLLFSHLIVQ